MDLLEGPSLSGVSHCGHAGVSEQKGAFEQVVRQSCWMAATVLRSPRTFLPGRGTYSANIGCQLDLVEIITPMLNSPHRPSATDCFRKKERKRRIDAYEGQPTCQTERRTGDRASLRAEHAIPLPSAARWRANADYCTARRVRRRELVPTLRSPDDGPADAKQPLIECTPRGDSDALRHGGSYVHHLKVYIFRSKKDELFVPKDTTSAV